MKIKKIIVKIKKIKTERKNELTRGKEWKKKEIITI